MRFLITIDEAWAITVTSKPGGPVWRRAMQKAPDGRGGMLPLPDPKTLPPAEQDLPGLHQQSPADIIAVYDRIVGRQAKNDDVTVYGAYLFHNLLGGEVWAAMKAEMVASGDGLMELALCWNPIDSNLSRLHWEMMHADRFLIVDLLDAARSIDISVTRVVPGAKQPASQLGEVPRVLFAIGQPLTDSSIRPGAEIMSLLQHSTLDHRLSPAFVENASPNKIARKMEKFEPEVVHFISHGMIDGKSNRGMLILQPDPPDTVKTFSGMQIAQWLRAARTLPQIVVLSACDSAVAAGDALGPQLVSPLAAELVQHGVPIVVGMSGRVSELACRLFTRRFANALFERESLVAAVAKGRRAAFSQGNTPQNPDWAFPTLYLSSGVDADYVPACLNGAASIEQRLVPYALPNAPVFCGRHEFFERYRELLDSPRSNVLAAVVDDNKKGYGRTRLLQQLTLRAVLDGNVPCPILSNIDKWKAPQSELELAGHDQRGDQTCAPVAGADKAQNTPIEKLQMYDYDNGILPELPSSVRKALALSMGKVTPLTWRAAIAEQFVELMASAREKHPTLIKPSSRAILLLDDADEYMELLLNISDAGVLGVDGFRGEERVSLIMTFTGAKPMRDLVEPNSQRVGWTSIELKPFSQAVNNREDMLAYARVLMNPFNPEIVKAMSDRAWFMDYGAPENVVNRFKSLYALHLKGLPAEFWKADLYWITMMASQDDGRFVIEATDDQVLKAMMDS